jgi:transcriptional regulator of arginine metabolism
MALSESQQRLNLLRKLLLEGKTSTQDELVEELRRHKFLITQSTISRDLRRVGAIKTLDASGNTVYRLSGDAPTTIRNSANSLKNLLIDIKHNGSLIVIHSAVGSANLIARHLDQVKPEGILGTIAGDDTIFVAPTSTSKINEIIKKIYESL